MQVQTGLTQLRARLEERHVMPPVPMIGPPRSLEPLCRPTILGLAAPMRQIAKSVADAAASQLNLADLKLSGGMYDGVWGELKALLVMTPRRQLMHGGMAALAHEEAKRQAATLQLEANMAADAAELDVAEGAEAAASAAIAAAEAAAEVAAQAEAAEEALADLEAEGVELLDLESSGHEGGHSGAESGAHEGAASAGKVPEVSASTGLIAAFALRLTPLRKPLQIGPKPAPPSKPKAKKGKSPRAKKDEEAKPTTDEAASADKAGAAMCFATPPDLAHAIRAAEQSIWQPVSGHRDVHITPQMVIEAAESLGADLSDRADEFFLLPLAVELCRAPLPGGWSEVRIGGQVHFVEETAEGQPQLMHPLRPHFARAVALERMRTRRKRELEAERPSATPRAVQHAADRWMLFGDQAGGLYYYNFATAEHATSLHQILYDALVGTPYDTDALVPPPPAAGGPSPPPGARPTSRSNRKLQSPASSIFSVITEQTKAKAREENGPPDEEMRAAFLAEIYETYQPLLALTMATSPRSVAQTLDTARAYQIHPVSEIQMTWLADLALSLPVPAGWLHVEHPTEEHNAHFWHSAVTGSSQWGHPVDDFVKACCKIARAPSHAQCRLMRVESLGRTAPSLLSGEPTAGAPTSMVEKFEKELSQRALLR